MPYVGRGTRPDGLHTEALLPKFGKGPRARRECRKYVEEAVRSRWVESPWENLVGGLVLDGKELLEKVRKSRNSKHRTSNSRARSNRSTGV